jgi:hypothetical protein
MGWQKAAGYGGSGTELGVAAPPPSAVPMYQDAAVANGAATHNAVPLPAIRSDGAIGSQVWPFPPSPVEVNIGAPEWGLTLAPKHRPPSR